MAKAASEHTVLFKELFGQMLGNNGKFHQIDSKYKAPFTAYVYTSVPKFFVSDGHHFVTTYFTKDCIADFNRKHPQYKLTDLHGKFITITSWALNLVNVVSENNPLSYLNMEIQLVIEELRPNFTSKMTCDSFLVNIYKDYDCKLDFAIYQHFRLTNSAAINYYDPMPSIEELEEGGRHTMRQNKWKVDLTGLHSVDFDLYDYDELVKKEIPELSKIQKEEVIEYMKNEYSSTYAGSKTKIGVKEKIKEELPLRLNTPDNIKLAIEKIIMYSKKPEETKSMMPPEPKIVAPPVVTKKAEAKLIAKSVPAATSKKPMTISKFQEYISWYEEQSKAGKFSCMSNKSSLKKPTPALNKK